MSYWSLADLQAEVGAEVVLRCFDDDNDGVPDPAAISRLQTNCDAYVKGFLRGIYDLDVIDAAPPNQVVRLSLAKASVICRMRRPDVMRGDWADYDAALDKELKALRKGEIRLDVVGPPEPGANEGGSIGQPGTSLTSAPCPPTLFFTGPRSLGDF